MGTIKAIMDWLLEFIEDGGASVPAGLLDHGFVVFPAILLGFFGLFMLIYTIRLITKLKSFAFFGG